MNYYRRVRFVTPENFDSFFHDYLSGEIRLYGFNRQEFEYFVQKKFGISLTYTTIGDFEGEKGDFLETVQFLKNRELHEKYISERDLLEDKLSGLLERQKLTSRIELLFPNFVNSWRESFPEVLLNSNQRVSLIEDIGRLNFLSVQINSLEEENFSLSPMSQELFRIELLSRYLKEANYSPKIDRFFFEEIIQGDPTGVENILDDGKYCVATGSFLSDLVSTYMPQKIKRGSFPIIFPSHVLLISINFAIFSDVYVALVFIIFSLFVKGVLKRISFYMAFLSYVFGILRNEFLGFHIFRYPNWWNLIFSKSLITSSFVAQTTLGVLIILFCRFYLFYFSTLNKYERSPIDVRVFNFLKLSTTPIFIYFVFSFTHLGSINLLVSSSMLVYTQVNMLFLSPEYIFKFLKTFIDLLSFSRLALYTMIDGIILDLMKSFLGIPILGKFLYFFLFTIWTGYNFLVAYISFMRFHILEIAGNAYIYGKGRVFSIPAYNKVLNYYYSSL